MRPELSHPSQPTPEHDLLLQQTFSTYESFYRALSEASASVPSSPRSYSSGVSVPPTARKREASRLTISTLAEIALPSTPAILAIVSTEGDVAARLKESVDERESDSVSVTTISTLPPSYRTRRSGRAIPLADAPYFSGEHGTHSTEMQPRSLPWPGGRVPTGTRSALGSRPRSRSVGSSTVPPSYMSRRRDVSEDASGRVRPRARSRSVNARLPRRSTDGGVRLAGGPPNIPSTSTSVAAFMHQALSEPSNRALGPVQPRSYFED
ncbi:hypothetical protein BD309DRAFT_257493 [Dichomitus squalens]|nr:hypothetical protein BD309DRAFT_257493 [Dichomitus squalens]